MRVMLVGLGHVGRIIVEQLVMNDHEVIVVDKNPDIVREISNKLDVVGIARDATNPDLYDEVDIKSLDAVIALTNQDYANLYILMVAKMYGVPIRIARVHGEKTAKMVTQMELGVPVNESEIVAEHIYSTILSEMKSGMKSYIELNSETEDENPITLIVVEIEPYDKSVGKSPLDLKINSRESKILLVVREDSMYEPHKLDELQPGDRLVIITRKSDIDELLSIIK